MRDGSELEMGMMNGNESKGMLWFGCIVSWLEIVVLGWRDRKSNGKNSWEWLVSGEMDFWFDE